MTGFLPKGFRVAGAYCGLKSDPSGRDVTLVVADRACVAAGVYTQNKVYAAPVAWDRQRTPSADIRVVVANSGNANACTGQQGLADAQRMAELAADACGAEPDQVLVLSTGVIGECLPMDKISAGILQAKAQLDDSQAAFELAARGIMTTDRYLKVAERTVTVDGQPIRIVGMAKGAGMIGPKMATMLGILLTDAQLTTEQAQELLQACADVSFNCISVEGHMSTNDTVLLLASGTAGPIPSDAGGEPFVAGLQAGCIELARAIPNDGEGASHLITIDVKGCDSPHAARRIAETIANSALVKTAIAGADPNWGRIVSAAGYAGVPFDPGSARLSVNGTVLYQQGEPVAFDTEAVSESIRKERETYIELQVGSGTDDLRFWTSDLTVDYVKLNADYHT